MLAKGGGRPPPLMSPASGFARRSSLTSLRRPPAALGHPPSRPATGAVQRGTTIETLGCPAERSKGGGACRRRATGDMSGTGRPGVSIAPQLGQAYLPATARNWPAAALDSAETDGPLRCNAVTSASPVERQRPTAQTSIGPQRDFSRGIRGVHSRIQDQPPQNSRRTQCQPAADRCARASRSRLRFSSSSSRPLLAIATVLASSRKCGNRAVSVVRFCRLNASATSRAS